MSVLVDRGTPLTSPPIEFTDGHRFVGPRDLGQRKVTEETERPSGSHSIRKSSTNALAVVRLMKASRLSESPSQWLIAFRYRRPPTGSPLDIWRSALGSL